MEFITSLEHQLAAVRQLVGEVPSASSLPEIVQTLSDEDVVAVLEATASLSRSVERLQLAASGVVALRSTRASGHSGIAQSRGHRNPVSLVQQLTGVSRAQATREIRVGQSLLENSAWPGAVAGPDGVVLGGDGSEDDGISPAGPAVLWHAPIDRALLSGTITADQHDAIRMGLGEPPAPSEADLAAAAGPPAADELSAEEASRRACAVMSVTWSLAADHLITEAGLRTLEELRAAARAVRDELDPVGAERRFTDRYEARSFRIWVDAKGTHHGTFIFDDESAAWVNGLINAALRPRRGGPRFVDPTESARADELRDDPRTNEQLTHDLMIDVLRSGTLATSTQVFGTRQAGVRVVRVVTDARPDHAFLEGDGTPVPAWVADRTVCNTGTAPVTIDPLGNPLDVGREQRLFTTRQRIALSLRDGGCRWTGCDRPAAYCEAHHIDEWEKDHGRTDIDRGILLCRFHHMQLHSNVWSITRDGSGPFLLHPPPGDTDSGCTVSGDKVSGEIGHVAATGIELPVRVIRSYAWGAIPRPSVRFRPGESAARLDIARLDDTATTSLPRQISGQTTEDQFSRSRSQPEGTAPPNNGSTPSPGLSEAIRPG